MGMGRTNRSKEALILMMGASLQLAYAAHAADSAAPSNAGDQPPLSEIVVTAEKLSERQQDVPISMSVVDTESLAENNQVRLEDYYATIPGLTFTPSDAGEPLLAIRGIAPIGGSNPTVGVVIDDVPYGASTSLAGGNVPDLDPSDLARIEVLRGPQGTLYGASSMGGLIKYVTIDPSTEGFSGRVESSLSNVYNGFGQGFAVRGAVNLPISDSLAVRASAFTRQDPGYIDNVRSGQRGVNWEDATGGRLSGLWRPTDTLSVKISALVQNSNWHGASDVDLGDGIGDLKQEFLPQTGGKHQSTQQYSATIDFSLGSTKITSLTGYNIDTLTSALDSSFFTPDMEALYGVSGTVLTGRTTTDKLTQEIRATTPIGNSVDWLYGIFYTHERSPNLQTYQAADGTTGKWVGQWAAFSWLNTYSEYAAFTNLTVHFTDRFDVQLGGRQSHNNQTYGETDSGPFVPEYEGVASPYVYPESTSSQGAFTYLFTPRYKLSDGLMLYARLASGYRPGGPNTGELSPGEPSTYGSDKTKNYEIGVKGDSLNHVLTFDASLYHIDWRNIQLVFLNPTTYFYYNANGGRAKSDGVELSVQLRPTTDLTIAGWVDWDDAVLTQPLPSIATAYGNSGDPLPYISRWTANLSLSKEFAITDTLKGFVGGLVSYVGERQGDFGQLPLSVPPRQIYPAYAKTDLRAGARYEAWTFDVFANNVTDKRGLLTGGIGAVYPNDFAIIKPRTIGLSVSRQF